MIAFFSVHSVAVFCVLMIKIIIIFARNTASLLTQHPKNQVITINIAHNHSESGFHDGDGKGLILIFMFWALCRLITSTSVQSYSADFIKSDAETLKPSSSEQQNRKIIKRIKTGHKSKIKKMFSPQDAFWLLVTNFMWFVKLQSRRRRSISLEY